MMQDDPSEREELARFREEWKAEVLRNRRGASSTSRPEQPSQPTLQALPARIGAVEKTSVPLRTPVLPVDSTVAAPWPSVQPASKDPASLPLPPKLNKALEIYEQAVLHEQRSELDSALRLYRQAFRLDENVARVYDRLEYHAHTRSDASHNPREAVHAATSAHVKRRSDAKIADITQDFNKLGLAPGTSPSAYGIATGTLAHLVASWPSNVGFEPEDETEPVCIRILPEELLVHILQYLDTAALERFAAVNKKSRILTLDPTIWRYAYFR